MAELTRFCQHCGKALSSPYDPDLKFCGYCGKPLESVSSEGKFTVLLQYEIRGYLMKPDMTVTIGGENILLRGNESRRLLMPPGDYHLEFRSSIRSNRLDLNLDRDVKITMNWNRVTGQLMVKTEDFKPSF